MPELYIVEGIGSMGGIAEVFVDGSSLMRSKFVKL